MRASNVKVGIVLAYILMVLNALYGFVITPILIKYAGAGDYGVYKTISSLTASVLILDLGVGDTTIRYVAKYVANGEREKINNFIAMVLLIAGGICVLVSVVCFALSFFIAPLYSNTFSLSQLELAYKIFFVCCINVLVHIIANVFNGVISGLNKFIISHSISICKLLLRVFVGVVIVVITNNIFLFVCVDLAIAIATIVFEFLVITFKYSIKVKLTHWDKHLFFESSRFSLLMFISAVTSQFCSNLDNIVIGSLCGPDYVTIYSVGLTIFIMFGSIACAVSGVMLPTITDLLHEDNHHEKIVNLLIRVGRLQFILLSACIVGFVLLGKDFISVWLGNGFEDVYVITLILIIPSIFEYCINTAISILKAKNMLGFRTFSLVLSAIINFCVTILLVKYWSYIGAAIGTAVTYFVCSLIMMNVYYYRRLNLPILKIYRGIIGKTWICLLFAGLSLYVYSVFFFGNIFSLIGGVLVFSIIYAVCLLTFGLTKEEKRSIPLIRYFYKSRGRIE